MDAFNEITGGIALRQISEIPSDDRVFGLRVLQTKCIEFSEQSKNGGDLQAAFFFQSLAAKHNIEAGVEGTEVERAKSVLEGLRSLGDLHLNWRHTLKRSQRRN